MGWLKNLFKQKKSKEEVKIGDDVICIDDRGGEGTPPVVYRKVYKVLDISQCDECGYVAYDLGFKSRFSDGYTHCDGDKCGSFPGKGIHWAGHHRFMKHVSQSAEQKNEKKNNIVKLEPQKVIKELEIYAN